MSTTPDTLDRDEDLDLIEAALDKMMTVDDWQLSGDHLLAKMDRLGIIGERVHGARLRTIRAVDDRRLCEEIGSYATSDRITLTDRTKPGTAKHTVRTARDLRRFPILQQAAEAGTLTKEQLTSVLLGLKWVPDTATDDQLEAIQADLLNSADVQPPSGMRQLANKLIAVYFPDAEDDRLAKQLERQERQARKNRHLSWGLDGEGSFYFRGNSRSWTERSSSTSSPRTRSPRRAWTIGLIRRVGPRPRPNGMRTHSSRSWKRFSAVSRLRRRVAIGPTCPS